MSPGIPPLEIPWQLANTTQSLGPETLGPDNTTISLFTYVPQLQSLDTDYPNDRLIYLKFTVSVAPSFALDFFGPVPPLGDPLNLFGADALPIWRVLFDIRISPKPYVAGGIKPYFLAATPIRRAMIETGVVGQQVTEGDSKALAIGKSGSQMHEGYSSMIDTNTSSGDYPLPVGGFGSSDSTTVATGSRDVVQHIDTTQREASTERQELVSHMTNVTNVLSLLSAFGIGSPYLRYSVWPRPLRPLTVDPSDSSLWYSELLQRRSSGIEGIQEFYAIAAVPRDLEGFCINAQLRRFSVIPAPLPDTKDLELPGLTPTYQEYARLQDYLHRRYPRGTPADDLDVDLDFGNQKTVRLAVEDWFSFGLTATNASGVIIAGLGDVTDTQNGPTLVTAPYKTSMEVWLDMKRDEYEEELLKSPLAGGVPVFGKLILDTCFGRPVSPLTVVDKNAISPNLPSWLAAASAGQAANKPSPGARTFDRYRQAVFNWNAAEAQLGKVVTHTKQLPESDLRLDHPRMVDFALQRLARIEPGDPMNRRVSDVADWFGLGREAIAKLEKQGITDLRGLAEAINLAPVISRVNSRLNSRLNQGRIAAGTDRGGSESARTEAAAVRPPVSKPIPVVISLQEAERLRNAFGATLQARAEQSRSQEETTE